jgi:predicted phage tail protein
MLIKVKLLGELGRKFGRSYEFEATSPREIISALTHQLEGFREYMITAHENGIGFRVVDEDPEGMDYQNILMTCKRLIIAPVMVGGSALGRILLGAALIAFSFAIPGLAFSAVLSGAISSGIGNALLIGGQLLASAGVSLALGGIAQLLAPSPGGERRESFLFDRASVTTNQGLPVPLLYGRFLASDPLIISSSISTVKVAV